MRLCVLFLPSLLVFVHFPLAFASASVSFIFLYISLFLLLPFFPVAPASSYVFLSLGLPLGGCFQ